MNTTYRYLSESNPESECTKTHRPHPAPNIEPHTYEQIELLGDGEKSASHRRR